jgi:hypothetical protein
MDLHRYQVQVQRLTKYADIPQIPSDPYDVPVSLAKQLFEYQATIYLTPDQQNKPFMMKRPKSLRRVDRAVADVGAGMPLRVKQNI